MPGGHPQTAGGVGTRAQPPPRGGGPGWVGGDGPVLQSWELWGRGVGWRGKTEVPVDERSGVRVESGRAVGEWALLSARRGDMSLGPQWGAALFPVEGEQHGADFDAFRLVMTGPSRAGGRAMFLSGFELFGQVRVVSVPLCHCLCA